MSDSIDGMRRKLRGIIKVRTMVKTMKVIAASNARIFEKSVVASESYLNAIELAIGHYIRHFRQKEEWMIVDEWLREQQVQSTEKVIIVFGTDMGLVGQFNDVLIESYKDFQSKSHGRLKTIVFGERLQDKFDESEIMIEGRFDMPKVNEVVASTVNHVLSMWLDGERNRTLPALYLLYNRYDASVLHQPMLKCLLPISGEDWERLSHLKWPTNLIEEGIGDDFDMFEALLQEYVFIGICRACVTSIACESLCRMSAMQRAEKNIEDLAEDIEKTMLEARQTAIDGEIFDVISGSEQFLNNDHDRNANNQ